MSHVRRSSWESRNIIASGLVSSIILCSSARICWMVFEGYGLPSFFRTSITNLHSSSVSVSQAFPQDPPDHGFQNPSCSYSLLYFLSIHPNFLRIYPDFLCIPLVGYVLCDIFTWWCLESMASHGIIESRCIFCITF